MATGYLPYWQELGESATDCALCLFCRSSSCFLRERRASAINSAFASGSPLVRGFNNFEYLKGSLCQERSKIAFSLATSAYFLSLCSSSTSPLQLLKSSSSFISGPLVREKGLDCGEASAFPLIFPATSCNFLTEGTFCYLQTAGDILLLNFPSSSFSSSFSLAQENICISWL